MKSLGCLVVLSVLSESVVGFLRGRCCVRGLDIVHGDLRLTISRGCPSSKSRSCSEIGGATGRRGRSLLQLGVSIGCSLRPRSRQCHVSENYIPFERSSGSPAVLCDGHIVVNEKPDHCCRPRLRVRRVFLTIPHVQALVVSPPLPRFQMSLVTNPLVKIV